MIGYSCRFNEEIARWTTEVYIKCHPEFNWWIAFTNPTAGPWKNIISPNEDGTSSEVYRFTREEERPDLILVNDVIKAILIVEAKDCYEKLVETSQMGKSIRVIISITKVLTSSENLHWSKRMDYKIIPSFLWITKKKEHLVQENEHVIKSFDSTYPDEKQTLFNIVITEDDNNLTNNFIYKERIYTDLGFRLD